MNCQEEFPLKFSGLDPPVKHHVKMIAPIKRETIHWGAAFHFPVTSLDQGFIVPLGRIFKSCVGCRMAFHQVTWQEREMPSLPTDGHETPLNQRSEDNRVGGPALSHVVTQMGFGTQ
jgi:hypothetical protein